MIIFPASIRKTAKVLNINTDAKYRFERGIDPNSIKDGLELATALILEICGGQASKFIITGKTNKKIILKGGIGGRGNSHFKTSTRQTPRYAQPGKKGIEMQITLELKLLADVGLVGFPNAGKSTLLSEITSAKPKIADYEFTTLKPNLGIVNFDDYRSFVMADIPGLLEKASEGVGLGFEFLKHLSRARALLHVVDIFPSDGSDPASNYLTIESELKKFDEELYKKPRYVAINKIDLIEEIKRDKIIKDFLKKVKYKGNAFNISALNGMGCKSLIFDLYDLIEQKNEE